MRCTYFDHNFCRYVFLTLIYKKSKFLDVIKNYLTNIITSLYNNHHGSFSPLAFCTNSLHNKFQNCRLNLLYFTCQMIPCLITSLLVSSRVLRFKQKIGSLTIHRLILFKIIDKSFKPHNP